jgi:DNA-binding NarL/FixJ family response regulator
VLFAADMHDADLARTSFTSLVEMWSTHGRLPQLAGACLQAFAYLSAAAGDHAAVVRVGAVLARSETRLELIRYFGRRFSDMLASARSKLSADEAEAAGTAGAALTQAEACEAALASVQTATPPRVIAERVQRCGPLTAREAEVLRLAAEGKTNRQIAETLVLSHRTVAKHLDHIYTKLAVTTRAAAVATALRTGLT